MVSLNGKKVRNGKDEQQIRYLSIVNVIGLWRHNFLHPFESFVIFVGHQCPCVLESTDAVVVQPRQQFHEGVVVIQLQTAARYLDEF